MALSIHDVLHAIVGGARELLNDAEWVAEAHKAIDQHAQQSERPAVEEQPTAPAETGHVDAPPVGEQGGGQ
jgi:hypothetical protein